MPALSDWKSFQSFFSNVFQRVREVHQYRFLVKKSCTFLSSLHTVHPHLRCSRKNELQWRKSRDSSGPDLNGDLREVHNSEGTIRMVWALDLKIIFDCPLAHWDAFTSWFWLVPSLMVIGVVVRNLKLDTAQKRCFKTRACARVFTPPPVV